MSVRFEEIDWRETPIGAISLRRRRDPRLDIDVYEVKLDDEYLMSSLFTVAEVELARLGLAELSGSELDVVVGGLGLGYTARAALTDPRLRSLTVIEAIDDVIRWHRQGLLPLAGELTGDPRTRLVHGDLFAMLRGAAGLDPDASGQLFHAILVDIDHSPRQLLHPSHAEFYEPVGLRRLIGQLHPGGVFALWSNDPPDSDFVAVLGTVFATVVAHVVDFSNPLEDRQETNTVYVAHAPAAALAADPSHP